MIKFVGQLAIHAIAIMVAAFLLPGVYVESFLSAVGVALVLSLLNTFVKPLLILLTIPITLLTFGLFLIVINVLIIFFADQLLAGFQVNGFWWAVLFGIIVSILKSFMGFDNGKKQSKKGH
jgi:putative membrane protein